MMWLQKSHVVSGPDNEPIGNTTIYGQEKTFECNILDDIGVDGTMTLLYRNSTLPITSKTFQGDFTYNLSAYQHGTVLELIISVEDEYENTNTTIIHNIR